MTRLRLWFWQMRVAYLNACLDRMPAFDPYTIDTIHQYGSATLDASSPHYADQAPIFAEKKWKQPPMRLDDLLKQATRDYRVSE